MNSHLLNNRPHLIPSIITAIMLLLALAPWPYGYYQLLRFVVCGASVYTAFVAYNWQKMWAIWLFGFIALLFNPLIPIHLSREIWQPIDIVCAILFMVIAIILNEPVSSYGKK
ncbi:MAG: hypothetical protein KAQ89_01300 [Planctomycetes bacterium]|nr:hypothetical protein [Planctomycetota bacterium]